MKVSPARITRNEQYSRNINGEIGELKTEGHQSFEAMLNEIGEVLGELIERSDVEVVYRVPLRTNQSITCVIIKSTRRT